MNSADNALGQVSAAGNPYDNAFAPFLDLSSQLAKGYMTAHSTLTILGVECNEVVSAETLMMVKEHVIEAYGPLVHTIGAGASGGAIQQYTAANNYPGLIDAGTPIISFPDMTTTFMTVGDCQLLDRVFNADRLRWTEVKRQAVLGHRTSQICADWDSAYASLVNPSHCDPAVPAALVYDPKKNPGGVRCALQDDSVNVWGRDPKSGFARRPLDNTGIQYGLSALKSGVISASDFVALNAAVGGLDIDGNHTAQRMDMGADVARIAYDTGRVTGRGALDQTPIIDNHPNLDLMPVVDVHDAARPFMTRARMDAHLGGHGSQGMWQGAPYPSDGFAPAEQWLTNIESKGSDGGSRAQTVAAARPASASDRCTLPFGAGVPGTAPCDSVVATSPRIAAGGPKSEDVVKCSLEPVDAADYKPALSAADVAALQRAFPTGVCNWALPGVGETPRSPVWLSFGDSALAPTPLPLKNYVARSASPGTDVLGASAVRGIGTGASTLPATGGDERWALLACAVLLGALALRGTRRRSAS